MSERNFFAELKRRNVYKVAVAYAVVGWLLVQIATQVFPFLEIPNWVVRLVIALVAIGFPIALVMAWAFELTPEGIKRDGRCRSDAGSAHHGNTRGFCRDHRRGFRSVCFSSDDTPRAISDTSGSRRLRRGLPAEKSIAVLPFENLSDDKTRLTSRTAFRMKS